MKNRLILLSMLFLCCTASLLHAQMRYVRNIPIQIPDWAFTPKYTPKEIYPTPDGGVIILGDCEVCWGNPDFPNHAADAGAIKLDANGICLWQWWSRNFIGSGPPRIVGIDQETNGRINFLINNAPDYNQIGWIEPNQNYSLQEVQWITEHGFILKRSLRLPDNSIFTIGSGGNLPYPSAYFAHLSAGGDTLSTRTYPPDSLWIQPASKRGEAHDMELDTDGMPVITCTFTDMSGSVLKTDWNGNIIWRRDTNVPCAYNSFAISKVPQTNELVIGYPVYNDFRYDYFVVYKITETGIDSLFTINTINYTSGFLSMTCHNQGLYLAGASQHAQVSVVNYSLTGFCEWIWTGQGNDWQKGTERISVLPDSSIIYVYCGDDFGSFVFITKLLADGTGNEDNAEPEPQNILYIYPNPMTTDLTIDIKLNNKSTLSNNQISIYNIKGQLIKQVEVNYKSQNILYGNWDGLNKTGNQCRSGMYFAKFKDADTLLTKKFMIVR